MTRDTSSYTFVSERLLETSDSTDFVIQLGNELNMVWAYNDRTSDWFRKHNDWGRFTL